MNLIGLEVMRFPSLANADFLPIRKNINRVAGPDKLQPTCMEYDSNLPYTKELFYLNFNVMISFTAAGNFEIDVAIAVFGHNSGQAFAGVVGRL